MKIKRTLILVLLSLLASIPCGVVSAQSSNDRPVIVVSSYAASTTPSRGEDFSLSVLFRNNGQKASTNLLIEFASGELIPRNNGGTQTIYQLIPGETKGISQAFTVSPDLWGAYVASVTVNVEYSDYDGNTYNDSFSLTVDLNVPYYAPTSTPTPSPVVQPQLVIDSYETDVEVLQPGTAFELTLDITNLGNAAAQAVSMVLGGGSVEVNAEGTPQPGISGGEGEFVNFAPLESSNVKFIGDVASGESFTASQKIVVNVSTAPGAYSLKYSFIYTTESGDKVVDNQVITLLIYRMPTLEIGFYQDPGPIFANQMNFLPLQIMNLGKQSVVLGNMVVAAENAALENSMALVGPVEAGFYFTLDTMITPSEPGPLDVHISVNYTDDFNQPRVYETVLTLDVMESAPMEEMNPGGLEDMGDPGISSGETFMPGDEGMPVQETFWQKVGRFFKGLLGLDSGSSSNDTPVPYEGEYIPDDGASSVSPRKGP